MKKQNIEKNKKKTKVRPGSNIPKVTIQKNIIKDITFEPKDEEVVIRFQDKEINIKPLPPTKQPIKEKITKNKRFTDISYSSQMIAKKQFFYFFK